MIRALFKPARGLSTEVLVKDFDEEDKEVVRQIVTFPAILEEYEPVEAG